MGKFKKVLSAATGILGMGAPKINIPEPVVPAAPAPVARADAGANIVIGTPVDTTRASGTGSSRKKIDPFGALGLGGLSI